MKARARVPYKCICARRRERSLRGMTAWRSLAADVAGVTSARQAMGGETVSPMLPLLSSASASLRTSTKPSGFLLVAHCTADASVESTSVAAFAAQRSCRRCRPLSPRCPRAAPARRASSVRPHRRPSPSPHVAVMTSLRSAARAVSCTVSSEWMPAAVIRAVPHPVGRSMPGSSAQRLTPVFRERARRFVPCRPLRPLEASLFENDTRDDAFITPGAGRRAPSASATAR